MTPASFLQLQMCFGRFRSSRRNGKRMTIKNLFSKHQCIKRLRRKRPFQAQSVFLSLLMAILRIDSFIVAAPPRSQSASFKSYLPTKHLHRTFHPRMVQKNNLCTSTEVVL